MRVFLCGDGREKDRARYWLAGDREVNINYDEIREQILAEFLLAIGYLDA